MFKASKTVEFYASQYGVKPRSVSVSIYTPNPAIFKISPKDTVIIDVKGLKRNVFRDFYPRKPDSIEEVDEKTRLSWFYTKPKFLGNPKFLWGVSFKVDGEWLGSAECFNILEWRLTPEETGERDIVELKLKYRLSGSSKSTAIVGPIPSKKPRAFFTFEKDSESFSVNITPSKTAYGDIQTLIFRETSIKDIVDLNAKIRVKAWGREELLVSGRVEVESENHLIEAYIRWVNRELMKLPGKATLIYGLPDLKVVCRPSSLGHGLV